MNFGKKEVSFARKIILITFVFVLFLSFLPFVLSATSNTPVVDSNSDTNSALKVFVPSADALSAFSSLASARQKIIDFRDKGFYTVRVEDQLQIANEVYENNLSKEKAGAIADYSLVKENTKQIEAVILQAYLVNDEILALKETLKSVETEIDTNQVTEIIAQAQQEFNDQRYENATKLVDLGYEKINELQSLNAKTNAAYEAARKNIEGWFEEYWQYLVATAVILIIFFLLFRKPIKIRDFKSKIKMNEDEIIVLKNEIKSAQEKYFVEGKLPESEYTIKVNIYSEKIRDLNRATALLYEELEGLKKGKKFKFNGKDMNKLKY